MFTRYVRPALVLPIALLCMLAVPNVGRAAVSHALSASFDGSETPAKSFGSAGGLAVDGVSGDVYVADIANNVVDKFDASGKYVCQITGSSLPSLSECNGVGGSATPAGSFAFAEPAAVTVDNSTDPSDPSRGDVYVLDAGHSVIDKFSSAGAYLGQITTGAQGAAFVELDGVGVGLDGLVWVYQGSHEIDSYSDAVANAFLSSRTSPQAGGFPQPGFAVGADDTLYADHRVSHQVAQLNSAGEVVSEDLGGEEGAVAVATDTSTGEAYADYGTYVSEYDPAGNPIVQFGSGQLASGGPGGLAIDPVTGTVYVANAADGKVYVYAPTPGPRVAPQAASSVQATSATLNATVNPEGAATPYQFEYGTSTSYGQSAPVSPASAGAGSSPLPVSVGIGELEPGTTYHYRVLATDAGGHTTRGADLTFRTLPVPVISGGAVTALAASSATLNAQIDPEGVQLSDCHFDYGTTTAYGLTAACTPSPGAIAADSSEHAVSADIASLHENMTYHWRVVVSNANGTATDSDHMFVYDTTGGRLPDNRAYEMVSPVKKNGALLGDASLQQPRQPSISSNGTRVMTASIQCFAGAESCTGLRGLAGSPYSFSRGSGGWQAASLAPPAPEASGVTLDNMDATEGTALFNARNPEFGEDDFYLRRSDGTLTDVGPISPEMSSVPNYGVEVKQTFASAGFSNFVWTLATQNAPPPWLFDHTISAGNTFTMYEYTGAGNSQPTMVAVTGGVGSHDLVSVCGVGDPVDVPGTVSEDGNVVFFVATGETRLNRACPGSGANAAVSVPVDELYARVGASKTVAISEPQAFSATGPTESCKEAACEENTSAANKGTDWRGAHFDGASADGARVFFSSPQQLTDGASQDSLSEDSPSARECENTTGPNGCNLYEFECAGCSAADQHLVDVSAGDSSGQGPRVRGVLAVSADGSHVYFVAGGTLTSSPNAEGDVARSGKNNLYVYERDAAHPSGQTRFIATLAESDVLEWQQPGTANVTPEGRYLVFTSRASHLTPDETSLSGAAQVFRYDAHTDQLIRVSVGAHGFNDNGNRSTSTPCNHENICSEDARVARGYTSPALGGARRDLTMSDNGSYVFFQSPVALTPRALDDVPIGVESGGGPIYAQNVYEWHEGVVSLISDGRDAAVDKGQSPTCRVAVSVCLLGSDSSGANVFFSTVDPLVPQDTDTELDYYDARICTSESPCIQAPVSAAKCDGAGCQGAPAAPPAFGAPASEAFNGPGNLTPPPAPPKPKTAAQIRAQQLAKALRACRAKHDKQRRKACEAQAHKRYGPPHKSKKASHTTPTHKGGK